MDQQDRAAIEGLFERIARVAQRSGPRDRGAEALIQAKIAEQPTAPYYMAQTIIMQEKALNEAQARIEELEGQRFNSPDAAPPRQDHGGGVQAMAVAASSRERRKRQWESPAAYKFLGSMLHSWLTPDAPAHDAADNTLDPDQANDAGGMDVADAGGGFDFTDF